MENSAISLSLKALTWHSPVRLGTLCLLALIACTASAGDKIVFSDDKPKAANPTDVKPANDLFRSWNTKLETPNFDYSILGIPTIPRATLDRKEQRRQKNEQAERQQWMFLRPGELQQKEDEKTALGVANRPLENLDKEDSNKDYTFSNLNEKPGRQRQPGEIRSGNQTPSREEQAALAAQQQREREDSDTDSSRRDRTFTLPGEKAQPGAYPPGEASLATLFNPGKRDVSSADAAKGEFSLPDVFTTLPARPDKDRMKDFYSLLKSSGADATPSGGNGLLSSPGSASTAPSFSRPADTFSTRPGGGNSPFDSGGSPNAGYPQNRLTSPGLPIFNNSPGLPGSSPFYSQTPPPQNSSRNWASPPQEPPRRKF